MQKVKRDQLWDVLRGGEWCRARVVNVLSDRVNLFFTEHLGGRLSMKHRGVEYRIMQGIKPGDWKWSVETEMGQSLGDLTAGMRR